MRGHSARGASTRGHVELGTSTGSWLHHLLGGATHSTHGSLQASATRARHATASGPANAGAGGGTGEVHAGSLLREVVRLGQVVEQVGIGVLTSHKHSALMC